VVAAKGVDHSEPGKATPGDLDAPLALGIG
jgi:hypothetical protein